MSIFSDYKVGAASYDDLTAYCNMEAARDKAAFDTEDYSVENCEYYKAGQCTWLNEPCNGGEGCE